MDKHFPRELYRHFDSAGNLLYVGVAYCAISRLMGHKDRSKWFDQIEKVTIERYPNVLCALLAEKEAIKNERPRYNVRDAVKLQTLIDVISEEKNPSPRLIYNSYVRGSF